ncbi:MAG: hypothetical protein ACKPJJ_08790, partial [Planctomycetaceae bacterium]
PEPHSHVRTYDPATSAKRNPTLQPLLITPQMNTDEREKISTLPDQTKQPKDTKPQNHLA